MEQVITIKENGESRKVVQLDKSDAQKLREALNDSDVVLSAIEGFANLIDDLAMDIEEYNKGYKEYHIRLTAESIKTKVAELTKMRDEIYHWLTDRAENR